MWKQIYGLDDGGLCVDTDGGGLCVDTHGLNDGDLCMDTDGLDDGDLCDGLDVCVDSVDMIWTRMVCTWMMVII